MQSPPDLFAYNDFRRYLGDWLDWKQSEDPSFTKAECSRRLGLPNSRSYLPDLLRGKRLSEVFRERFIRLLELPEDEARFFRTLVRFNQAERPEERDAAYDELAALNRTPRHALGREQMDYYRTWRNGVVRALAGIESLDSAEAITRASAVPLTLPQVKQALRLLERLGLAAPDKRGSLRPTEKVLQADPSLGRELLRQLQAQHLELSREAFLQEGSADRVFWSNTISCSGEAQEAVLRALRRFQSEVRSIVHKDPRPADRAWQVNLQFFPLGTAAAAPSQNKKAKR